MKAYYYFLYRIYMFYKRFEKSNFTITTSIVSSLVLIINLMSLVFILNYFDLVSNFPSKIVLILFMIFVWFMNYKLFVKKEKFLDFNFKKDKKGGYVVVSVFVITALLSIYIGNQNRVKIFNEKKSIIKIEVNNE